MEISLLEIARKAAENEKALKEERIALTKHQSALQRKLMELKRDGFNGEMNIIDSLQTEVGATCRSFTEINKKLKEATKARHEAESELARLRREDDRKTKIEFCINKDHSETRIREALSTMLTKYMLFAEDFTRVNSMRLMAAQFARELSSLLSEKEIKC